MTTRPRCASLSETGQLTEISQSRVCFSCQPNGYRTSRDPLYCILKLRHKRQPTCNIDEGSKHVGKRRSPPPVSQSGHSPKHCCSCLDLPRVTYPDESLTLGSAFLELMNSHQLLSCMTIARAFQIGGNRYDSPVLRRRDPYSPTHLGTDKYSEYSESVRVTIEFDVSHPSMPAAVQREHRRRRARA